jgi:lysozyme
MKEKLRLLLKRHEGVRAKVYKDSLGIPTIGVGLNMQRLDTRERLKKLGVDYDAALLGKVSITPEQIDALLEEDIDAVLADLRGLFDDFDEMPEKVRIVLADLRFNVGPKSLRGFVNTLQDIRTGKYESAAERLSKSLWAKQVGRRSKALTDLLREASHEAVAQSKMEVASDSCCRPDGTCDGVSCGAPPAKR